MITFIAFLLTMLGCVNWLLIGLLQYDFVAGIFGFQASIFSRLCYILIGVGAAYLLIRIIVNKGNLKVFEKRKKKTNSVDQNFENHTQKIPQANIVTNNRQTTKYDNFDDNAKFDFDNFDEYHYNKHHDERYDDYDSIFDENSIKNK